MKERLLVREFFKVLWKLPISFAFAILDLAAIVGLSLVVVDDLGELALVLGFLVLMLASNYAVFREQRMAVVRLQHSVAKLEDAEADILLRCTGSHSGRPSSGRSPFPETKVNRQGFTDQGMPGWGEIRVELEGKNVGHEDGELVWMLDEAQTELPSMFRLDASGAVIHHKKPPITVRGRQRFKFSWSLGVGMVEQNPWAFALALNFMQGYRVVINYHTERFEGRSETRTLIIEGDFQGFRHELRDWWKRHPKYGGLANLVDSG